MISFLNNNGKRSVLFLILSGIALVVSFFFSKYLPFDPAWVAIILSGIPIIKGAAVALITEFDVKADLLVSLALIASVIIGEKFAAGEVAFIMAFGAMLEDRTVAKARAGIEKLVRLTPRTARLLCNGDEIIVPAEQVKAGDMLRVLAGEAIAVDGTITLGQTSIDQSVMTGESMPVDKSVGDEVKSGTVNQFGAFEMRATKVGEDSSLQRMIKLVNSADASKAKIVGLADRSATWIVIIALASAFIAWFVTGEIIRAVTILVVFCPCALVLATPTAIMAGIGNATKYGALVREGDALERLSKVTHIAFDKTGTLTYGSPSVVAVRSFTPSFSDNELFGIAASAERLSEHPLGKAITKGYKEISGKLPIEPKSFTLIAGQGVTATVGKKTVLAGNTSHLERQSITTPAPMQDCANKYKNDGCTVIYVAADGFAAGIVALSDFLRSDARQVVKSIENINVHPVLLTGDNKQAAAHIASEAGITEYYADCLPETKLNLINRYGQESKLVCMVGDGINDAPALKKAHVGIAMGGIGSDIAIDVADIVLVRDDIKYLPHLIRLAKKTMTKIKVNLIASMVLNFAAIILAITGLLNPILGALVHNIGSVVVIINSALLLNFRS